MLTKSKIDRFNAIARDLYVKEYLGIDEYGIDKDYEDKLTIEFSKYLQNLFYNIDYDKDSLIECLNEKEPQHKSNIIKILRVT